MMRPISQIIALLLLGMMLATPSVGTMALGLAASQIWLKILHGNSVWVQT